MQSTHFLEVPDLRIEGSRLGITRLKAFKLNYKEKRYV